MNYFDIYSWLIERAKNRKVDGYTESHHIIPRCMKGSNSIENLVNLTPEEHYIAHLLLVKIYPKNRKILFAANMMANRNNKTYGWIKKKFAKEIRIQNKGQIVSVETRKRRSSSLKGIKKTEIWKKQQSELHKIKLEYKGVIYFGYEDLKLKTNVSRYLYTKFYLKDIDPVPYINNKVYGLVNCSRTTPSRAATGKKWFNNGIEEKYFLVGQQPTSWNLGRLK